jgi:hypothetical protein
MFVAQHPLGVSELIASVFNKRVRLFLFFVSGFDRRLFWMIIINASFPLYINKTRHHFNLITFGGLG